MTNRPLKFRAWHPALKRMIQFSQLDMIHLHHYNLFADSIGNIVYHTWHKKVPIMQFADCQDNTGKDAYEGDIIKIKQNTFQKYIIGEIIWDSRDLKWAVKCKDFGAFPRGLRHFKFEFEIIGNIYERPHLMDESLCHICQQPKNREGKMFCSYPHPSHTNPEFTETSTNIIQEAHQEYLKSLPQHPFNGGIIEDVHEENIELDRCPQCGEYAWDGYICHNCGMKNIGE
jgi:hypothetical protein